MTSAGRPLRVSFAIPHLARGGGAERVMLTLLHRLDRVRFEPRLLVLDATRNELAAELPADVAVTNLGVSRVRYAWRPLTRALAAERPDVLLSGLGHLNLLIAMLRPRLPRSLAVIGRETSVVTVFNDNFRTAALRNFAYRRCYRNLDLVICQSRDMQNDLVDRLAFPRERTRLVPNPVDVERVRMLAATGTAVTASGSADPAIAPADPARPLRLVAVGRLAPQKGFDLLLDAVARLPERAVELDVIGDGPVRGSLEEQCARLGLGNRVRLRGFDANPYAWMRRADALVLSSRYEGLPNAVLEALAAGTPVIATPCPGGLDEIAANTGGVTLAAAISAEAIAAAITRFAAVDPAARSQTIDIGRYEAGAVVRAYEAVIDEAAAIAGARSGAAPDR
ncbi:MAG: glycosyltransferase [Lautropia sp.]